MANRTDLHIAVNESVKDKLREIAERAHISPADVCRLALDFWIFSDCPLKFFELESAKPTVYQPGGLDGRLLKDAEH